MKSNSANKEGKKLEDKLERRRKMLKRTKMCFLLHLCCCSEMVL